MRIWIISREEKIIETDKYKRTEKVKICILRRREIFRGGVLINMNRKFVGCFFV